MSPTRPAPPQIASQVRAEFFDSLPGHFERLRWNRNQLTSYQTERLRALLRVAMTQSPFHRRRLRGFDPDSFELADLPLLPPMTKPEMMASYSDVVTDRGLTLDTVNAHLEAVDQEPSLLLDRYVVLATGGSSGVRGVFASDVNDAAQQIAAVIRRGLAGLAQTTGWPPPGPAPMAIVAAPSCIHATRCLASLFLPGRLATVTFAPVTLPLADIIERVQRAQPMILIGYPPIIARLGDAQSQGELDINPRFVAVTSEQLTGEQIDRITTGLGVPPTNSYGTSEGLMGTAPPGSAIFDFASDLAFVEFVDKDDQPVQTGQPADHILVTNLSNTVQPLIRYRIDDRMTPAPPSPEHGHQRATVTGRNDDEIHIGGVAIHPITIRSVMSASPEISEFRINVHDGAEIHIDIVATAHLDVRNIEDRVRSALLSAGARPRSVVATVADDIPRDSRTGKFQQFTID